MGSLIRSFTVGRNALKRDPDLSARSAMTSIEAIKAGADLSHLKATDNGTYNVIRDLISFAGIIKRVGNFGGITEVGEAFERLYHQNPTDAWRWLLTRMLWLYTVPNGTQAGVNKLPSLQHFDFFRRFVGLLVALSALTGDERYLSYEELCKVYDDDAAWIEEPPSLFRRVIENRQGNPGINFSPRSFLDDLENEYSIPRDNFAALIGKAFSQTGLFEYRRHGQKTTAIALSRNLDAVLQRRVRFVLDNPQQWSGGEWEDHLAFKSNDLPEEVSLVATEEFPEVEIPLPIAGLVDAVVADFSQAGLKFDAELIKRFAASLIAKRFVIFTGLSGSGKTKLAQAFATWLCPRLFSNSRRFLTGDIIAADRIEYRVRASDELSVEVESIGSTDETRVALPYGLLEEWTRQIEEKRFTRSTPAREIRDAVVESSAYSSQLSTFESPLKALAFALLEPSTVTTQVKHLEVVSVGPDWHSKDACLGYVDALNSDRFIRSTPIIDLILRAIAAPTQPFFLILDEMNLSHVERYFADFLSAAESGEEIYLHGHPQLIDGVPSRLAWPLNLFVIGTVNVDETTYVFSPKVLDRANTIEFRIPSFAMDAYLSTSADAAGAGVLDGRGARFSTSFLKAAESHSRKRDYDERLKRELMLLFEILRPHNLEFGFRTAKEITLFFDACLTLDEESFEFEFALDAQILQKVLPKLNGSRQRLEGVICALAVYATSERRWSDGFSEMENFSEISARAEKAAGSHDPNVNPLATGAGDFATAPLRRSFGKLRRMHSRLLAEGFGSFAEA